MFIFLFDRIKCNRLQFVNMDAGNKVTIRDIAKIAKVSHVTVARALDDSPLVKESTKKKIIQISKQVGYVPNTLAKNLATHKSNTIGMIIPDIMNPFYAEVAKGIKNYAGSKGINLIFCDTDRDIEKEKKYIKELSCLRVGGVIVSPVSTDISHITQYFPSSSPIVFMAKIPGFSFVVSDSYQAAYSGTEYLIHCGHRNIAFIGHEENSITRELRYEGYEYAMRHNNLTPIAFEFDDYNVHERIGYELTKKLFRKLPNNPTGIMAFNDIIALGAIEAVEEMGYKVPEDISVVGIDDVYPARLYRVKLTTLAQDKLGIGELCAKIVIDKISNPDNKKNIQKIFPTELVTRDTCRCI